MSGHPFNVRVYGILIDEHGHVLLADERIEGRLITKFPGGGLRFGEGPKDCVVREFREEAGIRVEVLEHFYTTDLFQPSWFDPEEQLISIYYRVHSEERIPGEFFHEKKEDLPLEERSMSLRWLPLHGLSPDELDPPIDRKVAGMLSLGESSST